jgi:signal transduction histidine kinase
MPSRAPSPDPKSQLLTQEYEILHEVARVLHSSQGMKNMLEKVLLVLTGFDDLKVEKKAGIFLADPEKKTLNLYCTLGKFTEEFLEKEKVVPYGDCLCGRVAEAGELLMSESCFSDARHERRYEDMQAHGHYIVPLKTKEKLLGVMFLYTNTNPSWYKHSQEVLLSIGGLVADAIEHNLVEEELSRHRNQLEEQVAERTADLNQVNTTLHKEILERTHAEQQLTLIREQLRNLSNHLQNIREEEKTRIAREVHDELGQSLTALKMDLVCLKDELPGTQPDLLERVDSMSGLIDSTITSVQRISSELRPQILDVMGLCEAIAWQAKEYQKRTNLQFDLHCEHIPLNKELITDLFRIFQEALTNIVRHAQASLVRVCFHQQKEKLTMEIEDDGRGIPPGKIDDCQSLGLIGIRERVLFLRGEVQFLGEPSKGTRVVVEIPLQS